MTATPPATPPVINPSHAALLVMDYQRAILERLPDADDLLRRTAGAIAVARARGVHVGYVRVAFQDADYAALPSRNRVFAAAAASRSFDDDAPETAIDDRVAPEPGDIVVRKTRVGAFSTTDLAEQLRTRGITTLILAGISTSGVVLSTVRDAADHDYEIFVVSDGCADPDPELHAVLTEKVFPRQAQVVTIADLPRLFAD
jgi:nicotinamidase-related amidase